MTKLICLNKQCNKIIVEDIERIEDVKFIQCPYCKITFKNPNYKKKK